MTPAETAAILRQFNEWRRGDEDIPQPDPREIGEAIDAAIAMIERLEAAEKERDTLRAKIEAMEKQQPVCITTKAHLAAMENEATRYIVGRDPVFSTRGENDVPLYLAPGAKGE